MAVAALTTAYLAVAASTTGGTAPGTASAPTGCSLSSASDISSWLTQMEVGSDYATQDTTTFGSGGYTMMVAGLKTGTANFNLLLGHCTTVWLQATPEDHMRRVAEQGDMRPMAGSQEAMDDLRRILDGRAAPTNVERRA